MGNFSEIKTRNDFADFLRIPRNKLTHILYVKKPDSYYKTFEIPKKNGDKRKICAPSGNKAFISVNFRVCNNTFSFFECMGNIGLGACRSPYAFLMLPQRIRKFDL